MAKRSEPKQKIVPIRKRSELEKFAEFFHQDYHLLYSDFFEAVEDYKRSIPPDRRQKLIEQLEAVVAEYKSEKVLRRVWIKAGAQAWPRGLKFGATLRGVAEVLRTPPTTTSGQHLVYYIREED